MLSTVPASPSLSGQTDDFVAMEHPSGSQPASTPAVAKEDSNSGETPCADDPRTPYTFIEHNEFFLQDAHVKLAVKDTLFRVHGFFFERESEEARSLLRQNTDSDGIIVIDGIKSADLACFLKVLYSRTPKQSGLSSKEEWASVLALAHRWQFSFIRELAIRKLLPITSPVDRIVLAAQHAVEDWQPNAYLRICEQDAWLSPEDCRRLGLEELIKIGEARQALRSPATLIASSERAAVVAGVFSLPHNEATDELERLRREAESMEANAAKLQRHIREVENAERLCRIEEEARRRHEECEEAERRQRLEETVQQNTRRRLAAVAESNRRSLEADRLRVEAERTDLQRLVRESEAKAAELARKAEEERKLSAELNTVLSPMDGATSIHSIASTSDATTKTTAMTLDEVAEAGDDASSTTLLVTGLVSADGSSASEDDEFGFGLARKRSSGKRVLIS